MLIRGPKKKFWLPASPALWHKATGGGGGGSTPAHIQSATHSNGATGSTTVSVTLPSPVSANGCVCLSFGTSNGSVTPAIVGASDDKGNTYLVGWKGPSTVLGYEWDSYYLTGINNGPTVFTATFNFGFAFANITADEYSNVLSVSALDGTPVVAVQSALAAGANISSGTTTPTSNGCLIYSSMVCVTGAGTQSAGSGYTQDQSVAGLFTVQHQVQTTAAAIAGTGSHTATDGFITGVYALKHT